MKNEKSFAKAMVKLLIGYAIFTGLIATVFVLFYFLPKKNISQSTHEAIVSIFRHGGKCATGECTSELFIYDDGSIVENGKTIKQLPIEQAKQLKNLFISTNFANMRYFRFTGTCPTAYDEQESIYTFYLPDRQEKFASCEYDTSQSVLFAFVDALLRPENTFCGGTKDIKCDAGYHCFTEGATYQNFGGTCLKSKPRIQAGEGEFCGGIGAIQCQNGYACLFDDVNWADVGGHCVKVPKSPDAHVCRFDAKKCPDGSYVARTGSKCEFAPCP